MIVLNEKEWAKNAIACRDLGKHPSTTLTRVAKYYCQCEGYKKSEARELLSDFLIKCRPDVILVKWSSVLDRAVDVATTHPVIVVEGINVTKKEMGVIEAIQSVRSRRLAFTLLCVAKYWNTVKGRDVNNDWVNTCDSEIMEMANIKTSIKWQSSMMHDMRDAGLLEFSKRVDNLNIRVTFIDEGDDVCMHIDDFRNLGNQYMMSTGAPFIKCAECGLTVKRTGNKQKYCQDCADRVHKEKTAELVSRRRSLKEDESA